MKEELNHKLQILIEKIKENPKIKTTYFDPDEKKMVVIMLLLLAHLKR